MTTNQMILLVYIGLWVLMTIVTLMAYKIDKKRAIKNQWRIKESTLLLLSFALGSIGGLISLYVLRHKNKHWYFVAVNLLSLILHIGLLIYFALPIIN